MLLHCLLMSLFLKKRKPDYNLYFCIQSIIFLELFFKIFLNRLLQEVWGREWSDTLFPSTYRDTFKDKYLLVKLMWYWHLPDLLVKEKGDLLQKNVELYKLWEELYNMESLSDMRRRDTSLGKWPLSNSFSLSK